MNPDRATLRLWGGGLHGVAVAEVGVAEVEAEFLAVGLGSFFKSITPHVVGDDRFIYCEASNEAWDQQRERIMKSALLDSREAFLRHGNLDVDHITMVGHRLLDAAGRPLFPNPHEWEIGRPVEVREGPDGVFVKGRIYREVNGDTGIGKYANYFWKSLTELSPPMRWSNSVGGTPLARTAMIDPHTKKLRRVITKSKWVNLAFTKSPQNLSVPGVSIMPMGAFVKSVMWATGEVCCDAAECDGTTESCDLITKSVTSSYETDVAKLSGGQALVGQSHAGGLLRTYDDAGARFLKRKIACVHTSGREKLSHAALVDHFRDCEHMDASQATAAATRLLHNVSRRRQTSASQ